jgi:hypothetical protein
MPLSKQEAFNKVWERAKDQVPSRNPWGACMYRAPNGKACFIGALMPDGKYEAWMDDGATDVVPVAYQGSLFFSGVLQVIGAMDHTADELEPESEDAETFTFYRDLQRVHDSGEPSEWASELRYLARKWNLEVPREQAS